MANEFLPSAERSTSPSTSTGASVDQLPRQLPAGVLQQCASSTSLSGSFIVVAVVIAVFGLLFTFIAAFGGAGIMALLAAVSTGVTVLMITWFAHVLRLLVLIVKQTSASGSASTVG